MPDIEAVCTNADSMRLKISVEMTLGEWREINCLLEMAAALEKGWNCAPGIDIRRAISAVLRQIQERAVIKGGSDACQ